MFIDPQVTPRLRDTSLFVQRSLVGGEWIEAGSSIPVMNPASGQCIGTVPSLEATEVEAAVESARLAWPSWRKRVAAERAAILERWHDLVVANADDLGCIMTAEQGKPWAEARGEVLYAATFIKWFAEEARRVEGQVLAAPTSDRRIVVLKQPVGVSAAITPWNFPAAMITRKAAPGLAAGCPVIVKPSELTPFTALALAVLAERAGMPPGVFSVVTGAPAVVGGVLTASETIRKLSFTGSTAVGRLLMRQSSDTIKRLSFELGGNAPFIVFDDADLDMAIDGVMASKFRNAGQTCVCANRILVQDGIHDRFVKRLSSRVAALRVGDGMEDGVTIGPLINAAAVEKVQAHLEDALAGGARCETGGGDTGRGGNFMQPTVITGVLPTMKVAREETFGPLAPVFQFGSEDEAIALANDTPFGLAAYFYTEGMRRSWRVAEALEFGMVGLNTGSIAMEVAPFGGIKQSGLGREGARDGMDEYLEKKAFHIAGLD